jgi:hypothetical protein
MGALGFAKNNGSSDDGVLSSEELKGTGIVEVGHPLICG